MNNCFALYFFFSVVFSKGNVSFFPLSFLSFCSLLLCFLFSQIFIDTVLVRHWFIQILVGCPFFFCLVISFFFLIFVILHFLKYFFVFNKFDLNWCSLFISLLFSLYFSCFFFFNFLVVCFSFFFFVDFYSFLIFCFFF